MTENQNPEPSANTPEHRDTSRNTLAPRSTRENATDRDKTPGRPDSVPNPENVLEKTFVPNAQDESDSATEEAVSGKTIVLENILDQLAESLAPQHQDLQQTLPHTSLKPERTEHDDWMAALESLPKTSSVSKRRVQPDADESATTDPGGDSPLDYLTLSLLGEGGMGTVHLARQIALGREVALKTIHQHSSSKQSVRDEFLTEAVLTGRLEHPNIVPIHEVGESPDGGLFYSMKNVDGLSWDETIDTLTLNQNLEILIDVCDAVAFAHAEGVVHRDLKPQNIMTGSFGEVLVLDWGLAILAEPGEDVTASAGGTPSYMAPEMIIPPYLLGSRCDVYLLGAILFRFLTGEAPHAGESAKSCLKAVSQNEIITPDADRLRELDPTGELLGVALKAMATAPVDRFQTVREFQQAVREFEAHQESLKLAASAEASLEAAEQSGDYTRYSESLFGFRQAVELWSGNTAAAAGIERSRQSYALCAEQKEDYELGLSLLDESIDDQGEVVERLTAARDERNARQGRLKRMKQGLVVAAILMLAVVTGAAIWINQERIEAENQRVAADSQRGIAVEEKNKAEQARRDEATQRELADKKTAEAEVNLSLADRRLYIAEMNLARLNWESGNALLVRQRIERYQSPSDPENDPRGFEWGYWNRLVHRDLRTLEGHTDMVQCVAFSPDGTRIASGSRDNTVRLWDAATGDHVATFDGHAAFVTAITFSPDGTKLVSSSGDMTVKMWDADTRKETAEFKGHKQSLLSVAVSPDGKRIASASGSGTLRLWDVATGEQTASLTGHEDAAMGVAFSPDSKTVASGSWDETVRVWDANSGELTAILRGHSHRVVGVAFSPDGKRLASTSWDKTVKLWDLATGKVSATLTGHKESVVNVTFSPDGSRIASASADRTVKLWDASTAKETATLIGHTSFVVGIAFSPDGSRIASGSSDKTVKLWDVASSPRTTTLAGHTQYVWGVAFSPDGTKIASASFDKTVKLWDATAGRQIATLVGHTHRVDFVAFSPDGTTVASASWDGTVKLWDVATGRQTGNLTGHKGRVKSVAFSPDGTKIASSSADKTIKLWDIATGKATSTLTMETAVSFVAYSPDGQRLASATPLTVTLWDVDTGRKTATLRGHTNIVFCVAFGPNGDRLVSASNDNTLKLWDVATGREITTFTGHTHFVMGVAFSPDGTRVASASSDETVKLWDTTTGQETATLTGHRAPVRSVAFSPDGTRVVSGSFDGTVKIWDSRPWSPDRKVHFESRGYLAYHTSRFPSNDALRKAISADRTINEQVRQQALEWSELFWKAYSEPLSRKLNAQSWKIVKEPKLSSEKYQAALKMSVKANALIPNSGAVLNTLGVAQYRAKKYQDALITLNRSAKLNAAQFGSDSLYDLVFVAMTHFQLDAKQKATELLGKVKLSAKKAKNNDAELDGFIKEAEMIILPGPKESE